MKDFVYNVSDNYQRGTKKLNAVLMVIGVAGFVIAVINDAKGKEA